MANSIISNISPTTFLLVLMIMISYTAESALGDILDVDISKLINVGGTGSIADVDPTRVAGLPKGDGQERLGTKDVHVGKDGNIAEAGEAHLLLTYTRGIQRRHDVADAHVRDIHVGKDKSITVVEKNKIGIGRKGR
ncbi:hypothetical protein C5167_036468 [Papaver somniferum]|uniref:Uncharacterized protein n=1 Tax=Papaver somniferum TaxID=3469 RepID=A0A4Y7I763_PAPSO|nr:hypothetical protein C5167_036468 [Papaver somniferum]